MLKIQLGSKIFQLDLDWRDKEDILTGDYFGVLDYLPRTTFLKCFFESLRALNPSIALPLDGIDWPQVEFDFWPQQTAGQEDTEPDVVIVSNRWVVVVEVKLNSGLQPRQAIREYLVGKKIARERDIASTNVFFLLVSRTTLALGDGLTSRDASLHRELAAHALYLPWFRAYGIVDEWLNAGVQDVNAAPEHRRLLDDLLAAMRYRHALGFSHFTFPNQRRVPEVARPFFLRTAFGGFMDSASVSSRPALFFMPTRFGGFMHRASRRTDPWWPWNPRTSTGFQHMASKVSAMARFIQGMGFHGFLGSAPVCRPIPTGWMRERRRAHGNSADDR